MNLYVNSPIRTQEFEIEILLSDDYDTQVWQATVRDPFFECDDVIVFVETVVDPDPRHLVEKVLDAYRLEGME